MARSEYEKFIKTHRGPIAVVRECTICGYTDKIRVGVRGVGRGYGMREGNKSRGRMIQHVKKHFEK